MDLGIMCRGIGTCYIELFVSDINPCDTVVVSAYTPEGIKVPLQQHDQEDSTSTKRRIVCLVPYLQISGFELRCQVMADDSTCIASESKTLTYAQIKWASRYNYRLKSRRTKQVKEICDKLDYRSLNILPTYYLQNGSLHLPNGPEYILKANIQLPYNDEDVRVRMLDGAGNQLEEHVLESKTFHALYPIELWGQRIYEVGFTMRIPDDHETYCIVVETLSGNLMSFLCIDDEEREHLSLAYNWSFYKICLTGFYHRALESGVLGSPLVSLNEQPTIDVGLFSIVVPLFNTSLRFLNEMVDSVLNQTYSHWELVLVNASSENRELVQALAGFQDARVRVVPVSENKGIAENTNIGIRAATGDYIFLLDHDDVIDPWALYEYAQAIAEDPTIDILYCDEDLFDDEQGHIKPHFKSDFNIDLLRCHNYITHFLGMRASLLKELMLDPRYDSAQDYDLLLRAVERTGNIKHVPHVLYHWRMHDLSTSLNHNVKLDATENGRRALQAHLDRCGLKAHIELTETDFVYKPVYEVDGTPLVSIIIPNKDNSDVLRRCIESIHQKSTYQNYEIIIIENNSTDSQTFDAYEQLKRDFPKIEVQMWEHEFNYSKINNYGVQFAQGEYLLFLNNDIEVISYDWIESLLSMCQRPDVGIVGAKLLFPDDTVQHAGVAMTCSQDPTRTDEPVHIFASLDRYDPGYFDRAIIKQDLSAVTGACLMTKRSLYDELGGFCDDYAVSYNDVDYCLRVREKGLLVVFNPDALLYHYESLTRELDTSTSGAKNYARFLSEQGLLRSRWPRYYAEGDPYHSKYCTMFL